MNDPKKLTTYTKEEVDAILGRNVDRYREGGRVSHDELMETAREIGMTTLEVEAAIAAQVKARAADLEREEEQQRAMGRLLQHVAVYVVVNVLLFVVARVTGGTWYTWPALGWGVALLVHAARTLARRSAPTPELEPVRVEVRDGKMGLGPAEQGREAEDLRRQARR